MNICHNLVHKPVRTCTYAHAHSRRDRATPIAHLVEIKHNVYMRALHSRDAYAYIARLDLLVLIIVEIHVSVNYKNGYYLYIL